jgi:class 3 adenylate cyclase/tetratricopeptide (TPR) repeat protein
LGPDAPSREQRKTVTVVFCDVTGSTALGESTDPEALRALLARYFERMQGIVESHGGTVEKFIGDAVMAVFGVPVVHEDDALRACRAALEMQGAFPELGMAGRIGVNTGEVVTGTGERLVTGDAVNVAARLEQAAQPGNVLIGAETFGLVRAAVEVGGEQLLDLKGKSEPVRAYPLVAIGRELERGPATPLVGRRNELSRLQNVFAQAVHDRSCQLFTILGSAGVGKSRLVAEFNAEVDAQVVRGRCLSYGDGITYWPVVQVLKALDSLPAGEAARPLRSLLGQTEEAASAEEIAWGFRKLLEQETQTRPLVVVFDDLHWAEETLLDLVEHISDLSREAPILLLCMARPELLERRPSWGGGKWNATTVLLEPLDAAETATLLTELGGVDDALRERIVQVAEGNPLFLEETLALVRDSGGADLEVPPTIQALLAARLDQLDPAERVVLERGSVEGRTFHRGTVAALADGDGSVDQRLVALVRKELVRPDKTLLPGDDAYRFRHLLIRDAAYDSLPKAMRAELHERFAGWLEQHGRDLVELEEILGYHLEQAWRARVELGLADEHNEAIGRRAADLFASSGRRALRRGDMPSAGNLLGRAGALLPPDDPLRISLLPDLAFALFEAGQLDDAVTCVNEAIERAGRTGAAGPHERAKVQRAFWQLLLHPHEVDLEALEAELERAIGVFEELDDDLGLVRAWNLLWDSRHARGLTAEQVEIAQRAVEYSRKAESPQDHSWALGNLCWSIADGALPVPDGIDLCTSHLEQVANRANGAILDAFLAYLRALGGNFTEAREHMVRSTDVEEFGHPFHTGVVRLMWGRVELLAEDPHAAERALAPAWEGFVRNGDGWFAPIAAVDLSRALLEQGRPEDALETLGTIDEASAASDPEILVKRRSCLARTLAELGRTEEALSLAREAVQIASQSDFPIFHGDALLDLAAVETSVGSRKDAASHLEEAVKLYRGKGAAVRVTKGEALLDELRAPA